MLLSIFILPSTTKPLRIVFHMIPFIQHFCIFIFAADPGPSADTDVLAEAQSGAAPTVEGQIKTSCKVV